MKCLRYPQLQLDSKTASCFVMIQGTLGTSALNQRSLGRAQSMSDLTDGDQGSVKRCHVWEDAWRLLIYLVVLVSSASSKGFWTYSRWFMISEISTVSRTANSRIFCCNSVSPRNHSFLDNVNQGFNWKNSLSIFKSQQPKCQTPTPRCGGRPTPWRLTPTTLRMDWITILGMFTSQ